MHELTLLPGYLLEEDSEFVSLIAPNGKEVSTFTLNADPREIERECRQHARKVDVAIGLLERLLQQRRRS